MRNFNMKINQGGGIRENPYKLLAVPDLFSIAGLCSFRAEK